MKIIHALKIGMLTLLIVGCNDNGFKSRTITIEGHKLELSANKFAGGVEDNNKTCDVDTYKSDREGDEKIWSEYIIYKCGERLFFRFDFKYPVTSSEPMPMRFGSANNRFQEPKLFTWNDVKM
ncbi:hypothetical protein STN0717CIT72_06350 [Citrobacter portucalensis]|nr:hypothetical protein STW0522CIT27_39900 [Citrobacter portucalensis]BBV49395.1 hypothetical protein STW0522CIT30_06550 [Citrobacter portucalensis]BBW15226.1 hypothetical protein STN0717CIT36_06500 [Citrobacter portucalensis]BBW39179.1 hypothetical protein STN0717CIT72_06350 [Citrobacter portucalensis]